MNGKWVELTDDEIRSLVDRHGLVRGLLKVRGGNVQREIEEVQFSARQKLWDALESDGERRELFPGTTEALENLKAGIRA